jgi:hypothetical protein
VSTISATTEQIEHRRSLRRAAYLTIGVGAAHAVLYMLSYWLVTGIPGARSSDAELSAFYTSGERRRLILLGLYLMPFAGITFMWFIVALRMWIAHSVRQASELFSNIQLVSGIIFIAMFFTAAGAAGAQAASMEFADGPIDPIIARQLPQFSSTIVLVFAMRMAAMFVFTTSNIGRSAGILPRWFTLAGFAVGLFLLLSASFSRALILAFPLWVLTLCAVLFWRARQIPADAVISSDGHATRTAN